MTYQRYAEFRMNQSNILSNSWLLQRAEREDRIRLMNGLMSIFRFVVKNIFENFLVFIAECS